MKYYDQLDLSFLDTEYFELDSETQSDPDRYLETIKGQFKEAVAQYQVTNPWELPIELDTQEFLDTLTLEQKVAQLFIFGFDGTLLSPGEKSFLQTYQPGGVIVMGKNVSENLS